MEIDENTSTEVLAGNPGAAPRVAFCSLLAIGGAALVTRGASLQGFAWWFLLVFLLGTLLEGNVVYGKVDRFKYSTIVALCFWLTLVALFLLTGLGPSRFIPDGEAIGVDFFQVPKRLTLLLNPVYTLVFMIIGVLTLVGVYIASLASQHTLTLLREWNSIPDTDIRSFKARYQTTIFLITGIATLVAYFAV